MGAKLSADRSKHTPSKSPDEPTIQRYCEQALALHRQGRSLEAERFGEEVLRHRPKHFDALYLLGLIALQTGRTDRGLDFLRRAIRVNPNVAGAFNNLGIGLVNLRRLDEALANFDRAIAIDPQNAEAHRNRGNVLRELERPDSARAAHERATALRAEAAAQANFDQALVLCRQGRFAEAENLCEHILRGAPSNFDALYLLGVISLQRQRLPQSIELIDKAIAINPNVAEAHNNLGIALSAEARFEKALTHYDKAIALRPDYAEAYFNRGVLFQKMTRLQDALTSYDEAIIHNPLDAKAHNNRGNVLADLRRFEDAVKSYDCAIAAAPNFFEAYNNRGFALHSLGRVEEALESYDKAIALKPDYFDAHVNRGNMLRVAKRYAEALAAYDRAIAIKPDLAQSWLGRGLVLNARRQYDGAMTAFDKALVLQPAMAAAWLGRGRSRCRVGRIQEGIQDLEQALKLGDDPELIRYEMAQFGAGETPASMPRSVVVNLFDNYANSFDDDLVNKLKYRTPRDLFDALQPFCSRDGLRVLDMGCGTGLVGVHMRPIAETLHGIDLSPEMLKKAQQRGIYDCLMCAEISDFLSVSGEKYDLVVAADVFIYIGDLSQMFRLVAGALAKAGVFCFSVEVEDKADFTLRPTGRYAHSRDYMQRLANDCGFHIEAFHPCIIREELGAEVTGIIAVMRLP